MHYAFRIREPNDPEWVSWAFAAPAAPCSLAARRDRYKGIARLLTNRYLGKTGLFIYLRTRGVFLMPARRCFAALVAFVAAVFATTAWAQSQELFRVVGVAKGDVLHMRSSPSADAPTAGAIPADASGIARVGECKTWCQVRYGSIVGWVNRRHLASVSTSTATTLEAITTSDPLGDCNSDDNSRRLAGCTAIIDKGELSAPVLAIAFSRRSDAHLEIRNLDAAIADRARALQLQQDDAVYKLRLGHAYSLRAAMRLEANDPGGALADYSELIQLDPSNHESYLARSGAYARTKDYKRAIADLQTVAKLQGETDTHRKALAGLYEMSGIEHLLNKQFDQAIGDFSEALKRDPTREALLLNRATAHAAKNDTTRAFEDYAEIMRIDPRSAEPYMRRGELLRARGSPTEAIADFTEALKRDQSNVIALLFRGLAREETKQFDEAIADYRAVLAIDSSHKLAVMSLERLRKSGPASAVPTNISPEARPDVRKSTTTPPTDATPTHSQGIVDGRWTGEWDGISATTILISGGKVVRYRFRGRQVPITRSQVTAKTLTFGNATYTVRVTFESAQRATAHYQNLTRGFTSSAILTRQ